MNIRIETSFTAWRDDRYFTKNPDMIRLPSGRLLCVFNLTDAHWPYQQSCICLIESDDEGRTWGRLRVIDESYPAKGEEPWVTPRLSQLRDGRLVVLCDQNDYRHCHESQPPGIYAWWSSDGGETWSTRQETGIPGIEPDRVRELADGTLIVGAHYMLRTTHKLGQVALRSADGGRTWGGLAVVASDKVHNYCEGAMVPLRSGRIACIMRENNHSNYPSYVSFSDDGGASWSRPVEAPFSGDRPFAEQLADGRVLVTYRNQAGRPGLFGWLGDIENEHGYRVSIMGAGPSHQVGGSTATSGDQTCLDVAALQSDTLVFENNRGVARYCLLPPESEWSRVRLGVRLRVAGEAGRACAQLQVARIGLQLFIYPDGLSLGANPNHESRCRADMTRWREVTATYEDGKLEIAVDSEACIRRLIYRETLWERSFIGNVANESGRLEIAAVGYIVENPTEPDHEWCWQATGGAYPNQYELERWVEIHRNANARPDHGYSTWVQIPDGRFLVLDYTNSGAPPGKAYLMGHVLQV